MSLLNVALFLGTVLNPVLLRERIIETRTRFVSGGQMTGESSFNGWHDSASMIKRQLARVIQIIRNCRIIVYYLGLLPRYSTPTSFISGLFSLPSSSSAANFILHWTNVIFKTRCILSHRRRGPTRWPCLASPSSLPWRSAADERGLSLLETLCWWRPCGAG